MYSVSCLQFSSNNGRLKNMACIRTLTKKGTVLSYAVFETVEEVWRQLNFKHCTDVNTPSYTEDELFNRDFLFCTTRDGKIIIQKRFIHSIE